jgi:transcriptional regulator with XRE-family HTH domain
MEEKGISVHDLSRATGVSETAIYGLLDDAGTRSSRLVEKIHKAIGKPPPASPQQSPKTPGERDELLSQLVEAWAWLPAEDKQLLASLAVRARARSNQK